MHEEKKLAWRMAAQDFETEQGKLIGDIAKVAGCLGYSDELSRVIFEDLLSPFISMRAKDLKKQEAAADNSTVDMY